MSAQKLVAEHGAPLVIAELRPVGHRHDEGEAVGQRGIKGFGTQVDVFPGRGVAAVKGRGRVHRSPAVAQALQPLALHAALMDDGEELVLQLGPGAVDLVDEDHLRVPHRGRCGQVAQGRSVLVRQGDANQVVEVDQRGIVESVFELEGLRQTLQQETLGGAVPADHQKRIAGGQGCEDQRLQQVPAEDSQRMTQQLRSRAQRFQRSGLFGWRRAARRVNAGTGGGHGGGSLASPGLRPRSRMGKGGGTHAALLSGEAFSAIPRRSRSVSRRVRARATSRVRSERRTRCLVPWRVWSVK